ncbi:hypothetical protein SSX86_024308 [Deinandra increscens subsp. villosa]|uniref:Uncharacterized protein n=1 Tax=Deinandra increscens subsp. villosa TaxID=3103831 RepID=A0AAP0CL35_9ASTR
MAHEQQQNPSNGGCKLGKKLKQNKVPQRGMGVAQLEKIILEEKRLKDAVVLAPNSVRFRRPSIPLPPPNRNPLISKSDDVDPDFVRTSCGSGNDSCRLYDFDGEKQNRNRYLITMPANSSIWAQFPAQRSQFQQPCSSSMVSVSLGTTLSSSTTSVMNIKIEPPSIQSLCANNFPSLQPDGDKMVGMKRSYPFSMENIPIPSLNSNIPFAHVSPISKPDESTASLELTIPFRRENPSSSGSIRDQKAKKFIEEKPDLAKDFLTLAPPQPSPSHSNKKEKLPALCVEELTQPSYQGQTRDLEWSNKQPLHSFFPAAKIHGISNGEAGEHVDLSLKL